MGYYKGRYYSQEFRITQSMRESIYEDISFSFSTVKNDHTGVSLLVYGHFSCFIGNSDFEGTKNKRTFVEHTLDDRIMNIINRL